MYFFSRIVAIAYTSTKIQQLHPSHVRRGGNRAQQQRHPFSIAYHSRASLWPHSLPFSARMGDHHTAMKGFTSSIAQMGGFRKATFSPGVRKSSESTPSSFFRDRSERSPFPDFFFLTEQRFPWTKSFSCLLRWRKTSSALRFPAVWVPCLLRWKIDLSLLTKSTNKSWRMPSEGVGRDIEWRIRFLCNSLLSDWMKLQMVGRFGKSLGWFRASLIVLVNISTFCFCLWQPKKVCRRIRLPGLLGRTRLRLLRYRTDHLRYPDNLEDEQRLHRGPRPAMSSLSKKTHRTILTSKGNLVSTSKALFQAKMKMKRWRLLMILAQWLILAPWLILTQWSILAQRSTPSTNWRCSVTWSPLSRMRPQGATVNFRGIFLCVIESGLIRFKSSPTSSTSHSLLSFLLFPVHSPFAPEFFVLYTFIHIFLC